MIVFRNGKSHVMCDDCYAIIDDQVGSQSFILLQPKEATPTPNPGARAVPTMTAPVVATRCKDCAAPA